MVVGSRVWSSAEEEEVE
jgi:hypothetical protein